MVLFIVWSVIGIGALVASTTSCTLSYQNIRTHGPVTDVDENTVPSTRINAEASMVPKIPYMNGTTGPK